MDCDTVVIGSGIGGLSAALALARAGQRVIVLEQHYLPGGWTHSFTLEGHTFSPGVHYLGELEEGANLRRFFEGLGVGRHLAFQELSPDGYDHLLVAGERYDVPKGPERHTERMKRRFPRIAGGIERYFATCRAIAKELDGAGDLLSLPALVSAPFRLPTLTRWGFAKLDALLDACGIDDPLARAFLCGQCGNHGLAPEHVSLPAHAVMIQHYMHGAYYPVGGAKRIPAAFLKELRAHGGSIELRTRVREILVERGRAIGVRLESGDTIRSKNVVSNADAALTYETLLPSSARLQRQRARRMRPSTSSISLFAATDMDLSAYDSGNYWWYRHADVAGVYRRMEQQLPGRELEGLFVSISSLKDPRPHREHTLEMFTFVPHHAFSKWAGSTTGMREAGYESLKRGLMGTMLRAADQVIPGLSRRLTFAELGTPLTNDFYCASWRGACYGIAKTPWQVGPFAFQTRAPVKNLYLAGASTVSHGVAGAGISGLFAAQAALGLPDASELLALADGSLRIIPAPAETRALAATGT